MAVCDAHTSVHTVMSLLMACWQDADDHHLPPAEFRWTTSSVWSSDGDVARLFDKDGMIASMAVCRLTSIITLATDMSAGTITVSNSSDSDIDIAGYTIDAEEAGEVCERVYRWQCCVQF